jgi:hypothetical protein
MGTRATSLTSLLVSLWTILFCCFLHSAGILAAWYAFPILLNFLQNSPVFFTKDTARCPTGSVNPSIFVQYPSDIVGCSPTISLVVVVDESRMPKGKVHNEQMRNPKLTPNRTGNKHDSGTDQSYPPATITSVSKLRASAGRVPSRCYIDVVGLGLG